MYGDPVYGEDFFDREGILSLLQRRTASFREGDKRNLALVGLRKVGKTSILLEFKRMMIERQAIIAAQREDIWIWDLSDVNLLMKLYGRFRIVH